MQLVVVFLLARIRVVLQGHLEVCAQPLGDKLTDAFASVDFDMLAVPRGSGM